MDISDTRSDDDDNDDHSSGNERARLSSRRRLPSQKFIESKNSNPTRMKYQTSTLSQRVGSITPSCSSTVLSSATKQLHSSALESSSTANTHNPLSSSYSILSEKVGERPTEYPSPMSLSPQAIVQHKIVAIDGRPIDLPGSENQQPTNANSSRRSKVCTKCRKYGFSCDGDGVNTCGPCQEVQGKQEIAHFRP